MIKRNYLTSLLLSGLFIMTAAHWATAADATTPLDEKDVTTKKIKSFFDAAFMKAQFDKDGDLVVESGGMKTFIKVNEDRKMITFISIWGLKKSVSTAKKLEFVNHINDSVIFVRFTMSDTTTLWCDYQFLYDGGITPYTIVTNYKLFEKVVKGVVTGRDPDDIIGED